MLAFDQIPKVRDEDRMRRPRHKAIAPNTRLVRYETIYQLLECIYQFGTVRKHFLDMLLPERSNQGLVKSLRIVFDHRLVDRIDDVRRYRALNQHEIYNITDKGMEFLSGRDLPYQAMPPEFSFSKRKEWDHYMMVTDLLANIAAGARKSDIRFIPAEEIALGATVDDPFIFPRRTKAKERKTQRYQPLTILPDGMFGLEYPNGKKAYFAIEAEHNKPHDRAPGKKGNSTRKKFEQYIDLDIKAVYERLGIGNIRVLVVAPTPTQIRSKFAVGQRVVDHSHLFLGHWLPTAGERDVPILPEIIDAPWLRIGLPEEHINAPATRTVEKTHRSHSA